MNVRLIGVKMDLGAGLRGVDMGPTALRIAGIQREIQKLNHTVEDIGDIEVSSAQTAKVDDESARYKVEIVKTCTALAAVVDQTKKEGTFPLVMGGDHSIAMGTISGLASYYKSQGKKFGVVWVDAHADMNTPDTSPSGNIHGMPLSACLGMGPKELTHIYDVGQKLDPDNVFLIGIREIDASEKKAVNSSGVNAYTMEDIDRLGIYQTMVEVREAIQAKGLDAIHVSFDVDGLDPSVAPGVGTPVPGGLTYREANLLVEMLFETGKIGSLELTEINPILDNCNQTAEVALKIALSALGKTIL